MTKITVINNGLISLCSECLNAEAQLREGMWGAGN